NASPESRDHRVPSQSKAANRGRSRSTVAMNSSAVAKAMLDEAVIELNARTPPACPRLRPPADRPPARTPLSRCAGARPRGHWKSAAQPGTQQSIRGPLVADVRCARRIAEWPPIFRRQQLEETHPVVGRWSRAALPDGPPGLRWLHPDHG